MKAIYSVLLLVITTIILAACGSQNSPEGVVKKELSAIKAGNYEKAFDCYYLKRPNKREELKEFYLSLMQEQQKEEGKRIKSFNVTGVEYDKKSSDKAVVFVDVVYANGNTDQNKTETIKVEGEWYLESGK